MTQIAKARSRIIESVARFDRKYSQNYPEGTREATLSQIREAHNNFKGYGKTGEFLLGEKQGDRIVFLLQHRKFQAPAPNPVPLQSTLAEPMRRALNGKSGVVVAKDYQGRDVLAAFEPVGELGLGLVAKIDMEEIQEPIFEAIKLLMGVGLAIIIIGTIVFVRVSRPLIRTIREREERFRTIFEESPIGIALIDSFTGKIYEVNPKFAGIAGRTREEITNIDWMTITHPDDVQEDLDNMAALNAGKISGFNMIKRYVHPDGSFVWINMTIAPVTVEDKSGPCHLCMIEDITLRKENEKKIISAQKQIVASQKLAGVGQLAAGVSHEVLNPVNIISVHAQVLQKRFKDDLKIQTFCEKVEHEINRIQKIMSSLLSFARRGDSEFVKGIIKKEIEKSLLLVEEEYKLDDIEIIRNWCGKDVEILFDPDKIRQVFLNLFQNAKSAMPQGGVITLSCRPVKEEGKDFHQFILSDSGVGMAEEVRLKIFEPFFTTKPEGEGTGLGLSVVHGIVEEHGGKIIVESEEGKGSTFIISFPLAN